MKKLFISILISLVFFSLTAQEALKSIEEEYYDFLSLQGLVERPTLGYRTLSDSVWKIPEGTEHIWQDNNLGSTKIIWELDNQGDNWFTKGFYHGLKYKIYGPEWYNSYNTEAPYGQNDGALWQGKGYNTSLTGGFRLEGYGLSFNFLPQISFSQNLTFNYTKPIYTGELYNGKAESYGDYSFGFIDAPQRFGTTPFFNFDFGDTEIRYTNGSFTFGFGTEYIWLGPAQINPILHSNNSEGYPKIDFGLKNTPIQLNNVWLGNIEFRYWLGKLSESNFFDNDSSNNENLITGLSISYELPFMPGLIISFHRTMLSKWNNLSPYTTLTLLIPFMEKKAGYDESDQRASFCAEYYIPYGGIDIYLEWAKNDYNTGIDNLIRYPFHTQAITAGFMKNINYSNYNFKGIFNFEISYLQSSMDYYFFYDWNSLGNDFYAHHKITQGYTNKGQYLGAGIGAGGNSQYVSYKLLYPKGFTKIFLQRINPDLNYSYFLAPRDNTLNYPKEAVKFSIRVDLNFGIQNVTYVSDNFLLTICYVINDQHNPLNSNKLIKEYNSRKSEHRFNHVFQIGLKYNL